MGTCTNMPKPPKNDLFDFFQCRNVQGSFSPKCSFDTLIRRAHARAYLLERKVLDKAQNHPFWRSHASYVRKLTKTRPVLSVHTCVHTPFRHMFMPGSSMNPLRNPCNSPCNSPVTAPVTTGGCYGACYSIGNCSGYQRCSSWSWWSSPPW